MSKIISHGASVKGLPPRLPEAILALLSKRGKLSTLEAAIRLSVDAQEVSNAMSRLAQQGRIRKTTCVIVDYYQPVDELVPAQLGLVRRDKPLAEGWRRADEGGSSEDKRGDIAAV